MRRQNRPTRPTGRVPGRSACIVAQFTRIWTNCEAIGIQRHRGRASLHIGTRSRHCTKRQLRSLAHQTKLTEPTSSLRPLAAQEVVTRSYPRSARSYEIPIDPSERRHNSPASSCTPHPETAPFSADTPSPSPEQPRKADSVGAAERDSHVCRSKCSDDTIPPQARGQRLD